MGKKILSLIVLMTMVLQLFPCFLIRGQAATIYSNADWEELIHNYKKILAGGSNVDWSDSEILDIVEKTNASGFTISGISYNGGKNWMDLESNRDNPLRIFGIVDITPDVSSATMGYQFEKLRDMALAYATKGTRYCYRDSNGKTITLQLYQNPELRSAIFYGLQKGHKAFYNYDSYRAWCTSPNAGINENWYDWATAAPEAILKTLMLLYPSLTEQEMSVSEEIIAECLAFLNRIRPNTHPTSYDETLAYRRSRVRIGPLISVLTQNETLMEECRANLEHFTRQDILATDGIKEDGSYIYHNSWPMEGMYGTGSLIEVLFVHFSAMSGTAFAFGNAETLADWILNTFRPVTHKGTILSMHCGRAPQNGNLRGVDLLRGALQLVGCCDPATDLQLKQFIRSMVCEETEADTRKSYASFAVSLSDVNLVSVLKNIVIDSTIAEDPREYGVVRYCGDRIVQHRTDYTVGIAMSSNRIAIPESINGCNRYGWFAGDGMVYVYNDRTQYNINQYGFEFWRHANMYRLPGITQEDSTLRQPLSNRKPYFPGTTYTYDPVTKTETLIKETNAQGQEIASFVGGTELGGKYIVAAMDFESYSWSEAEAAAEVLSIKNSSISNDRKQILESDLTAKKSYFLFDDEIVCLGSDIDFSTRNTVVNTYVDNRELYKISTVNGKSIRGTEDIIVDGKLLEKVQAFASPYHYTDPTWVYEQNFGGYYFPTGGEVYVNKTYRESSNDGDDTNDDFNNYLLSTQVPPNAKYSGFELWLSHGCKPQNGSYSYVMLPEKTAEETEAYTKNPHIEIIKCTESIHVVREKNLGITAMVFWKAGSYGDITVDAPLLLMLQEKNGKYLLSACDPTQKLSSATVRIAKDLSTSSADSEITVSGKHETILTLDLSKCGGATVHAEFLEKKPAALMFDFGNGERYSTDTYGFYNYADATHWASGNLGNVKLTVQNGTLLMPITTALDGAGKEIVWTFIEPSDSVDNFAWASNPNKANVLHYDPSEAEVFRIRLKLKDVSVTRAGAAGVYLCYLPSGADCWSNFETLATNPYRETIGISIPDEFADGGSKENQYITLSVPLGDKKLPTYDLIRGVSISFGNLRGGTATIDYIYIGPEEESLYFGFDNDGGCGRYEGSAYGGFPFDCEEFPNWASNLTETVGNYLTVDNDEGVLHLYTAQDAYGEPGAYLCTTAQSGKYAWSGQQSLHPLSFNPGNAEIIEVRFRTNDLTANGKTPTLVPVLVLETAGEIMSDTASSAPFTIADGVYQTVRIPLGIVARSADYIKSLGIRFVGTQSVDENSVGRIDVDYIYVGQALHAPSNIYFDFTGTDIDGERYNMGTYGCIPFDEQENWEYSTGKVSHIAINHGEKGTLTLHAQQIIPAASWPDLYVDTAIRGVTDSRPLHFYPADAELYQIRFKMKNLRIGDTEAGQIGPYMLLSYFKDRQTKVASVNYMDFAYDIGKDEYITVTLALNEEFRRETVIDRLRIYFGGIESVVGKQGELTIDYIFIGRAQDLPTPAYTVVFMDGTGGVLASHLVNKGETATYTGTTPTKAYDSTHHYCFKGWDKPLTNITADTTITAIYTATAHSYTYSKVDATNHKAACSCGYSRTATHSHVYTKVNALLHRVTCKDCQYSAEVSHSYENGLCICGQEEIKEPVLETTWKMGHTLNLASDISVNLAVSKSLLAGFDMDSVYVLAEIDTYEGNTPTGMETVKLLPVEQGNYYYFTLTGLTAVHMNDRIHSVLYGTKDGQPYYSATDDYSITDYAYAQMNKAIMPATLKTLCADLLRYGAKAQIFKAYRTDTLADAAMTDTHKAYLSDMETVTFGNTNTVLNDLQRATVTWAGKALDLASKVTLKFIFSPANYNGNPEKLNLHLTYADISGETKTAILEGAELYNVERGFYAFSFDGLLAAELRSVVSAQVYEGDIPVSCTLQYSADTYGKNKTGPLGDLCKALFAYSDSARLYFTN